MRRTWIVAFALVATACGGGGDQSTASPKPTSQPSQTGLPSRWSLDEEVPPGEEAEPDASACVLTGSKPARVVLVDVGDALVATFEGQGVAPTDTTGYYVSVYNADGKGGQMGAKYQDGELIAYFVDVPVGSNEYVDGDPKVSGNSVTLTFPKDTGGLAGLEVAKWNAAYTLAGQDVGSCATIPFPS